VTLQENNHVAILDRSGAVLGHFSAGSVDLDGIDTAEDGALVADAGAPGTLREPDSVKWLDATHLAVANEGDLDGGARGFTVFDRDGGVVFESGASFERAVAAAGHYPEGRSDSKGVEPEGLATGSFDGTPLLFVLAERASVVGVYDVTDPAAPALLQILPSGISPEGAVAIPARNLLATANEADLGADGLARAHVMIYERREGAAAYPTLMADDGLAWGALSGLAADPAQPGRLFAVTDSAYDMQPRILTIDATQVPPASPRPSTSRARAGRRRSWTSKGSRPTARAASGSPPRGAPTGWCRTRCCAWTPKARSRRRSPIRPSSGGGDALRLGGRRGDRRPRLARHAARMGGRPREHRQARGLRPRDRRMGRRALSQGRADRRRLGRPVRDRRPRRLGLPDRARQPYGRGGGHQARHPRPPGRARARALGGALPTVTREVVRDLLPDLRASGGYVLEKVEGLAVEADGTAWLVTDNDGTDDSSGETLFWSIGALD
jgi:hypothetical protein